jgi:hypothetical protein
VIVRSAVVAATWRTSARFIMLSVPNSVGPHLHAVVLNREAVVEVVVMVVQAQEDVAL